jgi:hypothetical protein
MGYRPCIRLDHFAAMLLHMLFASTGVEMRPPVVATVQPPFQYVLQHVGGGLASTGDQLQGPPWLGVSLVFLIGKDGFPAYPHWQKFFRSCDFLTTNISALFFKHIMDDHDHDHTPSQNHNTRGTKKKESAWCAKFRDIQWGNCGVFDYRGRRDIRFTDMMVELMHAGAVQSPVGSTVTFISDTSVPLRNCKATATALIGKVMMGKEMQLYSRHSAMHKHAYGMPLIARTQTHCKSTQWISLPRQIWLDHYRPRLFFRRNSQPTTAFAPDEWWIQTELCLNDTLRPPVNFIQQTGESRQRAGYLLAGDSAEQLRVANMQHNPFRLRLSSTHKVVWSESERSSHPEAFTRTQYEDAQQQGYLFIRKYDPTDRETSPEKLQLTDTIPQNLPTKSTLQWQYLSHRVDSPELCTKQISQWPEEWAWHGTPCL